MKLPATLWSDLGAGVVLSALLVPAGMAYAELAGLPPVTGLHATVASLVAYAVVAPPRVIILGPDSSLAPVIGAAIVPLAAGSSDRAVALAGLLALLVGAVLLAGALARVGVLVDVLSTPIRVGYLNGLALVIVVDQLPKLLGLSVAADGLVDEVVDMAQSTVHGPTATVGITCLALIVALRMWAPRLPGVLLVMVGAGVVMATVDPSGVAVVGALPRGVPAPRLDGLRWEDVRDLVPAAAGIALLALADTAALSRALGGPQADEHETRAVAALGAANVAAGLFGGFPVSGSASRTPAARQSGARTQLAGVIGAAVVLVLVLAAPGLTRFVPAPALAAVVLAAIVRIVDVRGVMRLWTVDRSEGVLGLVAFAGVVLLGVLAGIVVAAGLSLAVFVAKAWRPHTAELVRVEGRKGYHDRGRHPTGRQIPGLVILRFDAPLFFANASEFGRFVRTAVVATDRAEPVRWVAVAAEPITDVDVTAADELQALDDELARRHVRLVFAEMKGPVKDQLERLGLGARFRDRHFPTVGTAVSAYRAAAGVDYEDWTERDDEP